MPTLAPISTLLSLVPDQMPQIFAWRDDLQPIVAAGSSGRGQRIEELAARRGMPAKQVRKKFDLFFRHGLAGLIDRRKSSKLWEADSCGLSAADAQMVKQWCEAWQRKSAPALRALRDAWLRQRVTPEMSQRGLAVPVTETPLDPISGYPVGWSLRNLMRYAPSEFELAATRIGRSKAAAYRPLVYTTRANLYVGQFRMWDDIWHDHVVNDLDQRRSGRPLEFHGLDLASACKMAWGNRIRTETEVGHEGLKSADFRFLIASTLLTTGYHPQGTTEVCENGTAAISETLEAILFDGSEGAIKVDRNGMEGAAAHAGQYAGRAKGNFKFKAALESLGNLIHNEMAYLSAQTGMDRDHCPEEMHDGGRLIDARTGRPLNKFGILKYNDALLAALSQLAPERAQWLAWDLCTIQQFRMLCEEIYGRINRRTEHNLQGWDERYVPDPRTGKMRRLSPWEVYSAGLRPFRTISLETAALIIGPDGGTERTTRNGMIEVRDGEISGDALRFDATALPDREKFLTVLNPFDVSRLFVFNAKNSFVGALRRIASVDRGDIEAVHRACGEAAKVEAAMLEPLRRRHLAEAREKAKRHLNNAAVLAGAEGGASRLPDEEDREAMRPDVTEPGADTDELAEQLSNLI